jgi:hypothetical protein
VPIKYTPRLSVEISEEDSFALRRHLPTGFQKVIFNIIIKDLLRLFDKFGANKVVAAFCNQDISLEKMCRLNLEPTNDDHTKS